MTVTFLTMGDVNAPSSRVRALQYVPHLRQRGFTVMVHSPSPGWSLTQKGRFFAGFLRDALVSDVVVLQKRILPPGVLPLLQGVGCRVIYDFDDAVFDGLSFTLPFSLGRRLYSQIRSCDQVIVGNQYLRDHASRLNSHVAIVPSPVVVPSEPYLPAGEEPVSIGWIGTSSNLHHLDLVRDAFVAVQRRFPEVEIRIICDREWEAEGLRVTNVPWRLDTQEQELRKLSIGVMPLVDTAYARGKCSYKALQYMAQAIPVVLSPVGMSTELVKDGWNGFLASTTQEWIERLSALIRSTQLWRRIGLQGYDTVQRSYDFKVCAPFFESVLWKVLDED